MDHVENGDIGKCGVYEFGLEITFCHTLLIQAARGEKGNLLIASREVV